MAKIIKQTASMQTRDQVRLDADIYRPDTDEQLPILLMRQPYGRAIASTVVYAHPRWYAAQGYIVVIQDVRGRGSSEGEFDLFTHEVADGADTLAWVSQLPYSTGQVGMYGFSYQGMTQLYAAVGQPDCLKAIAPAMVAYDLHSDWSYENGAFCLYANLAWAIQLAGETARRKGDETAYQKLRAAAGNLPWQDKIPANPQIMQELAPDSFYHQWLHHPDPEADYWQERSPKYLLDQIDLPMLHVGGWFDPYLRGTLNLYQAMASQCQQPQHLLVGPWAHLPWGRKLGTEDYGKAAQNPIDELQIRWFNHWLKQPAPGLLQEAPISWFDLGHKDWRELEQLPEQQAVFLLTSGGLASIREDSGLLWLYAGEDSELTSKLSVTKLTEPIAELPSHIDLLVHDPWRPVPALGGHASFPGGTQERSNLDCRSDILTYTSAPLKSAINFAGAIALEVYCSTESPSFDLCGVISTVNPQGQVHNFAHGYSRIEQERTDDIKLVTIPCQATCIQIPVDYCLRLSISASYFPAYPVNAGTGQSPAEARWIDHAIITIAIHTGADYPSRLILSSLSD